MKITNLKQDDVLYRTMGVGTLPKNKADERIEHVRKILEKVFNLTDIILVAINDNSPLNLEIIRKNY